MDDGKESEKSNVNFKDGLSNIGEIIKTDARATFSNPIVIIVLIALIILPSLYALVNIYACWDRNC